MITPKNIIYTAMYKKGIRTITQLVAEMNKGSDFKYEVANMASTLNANEFYSNYLLRAEEVLGFKKNSLVDLYKQLKTKV